LYQSYSASFGGIKTLVITFHNFNQHPHLLPPNGLMLIFPEVEYFLAQQIVYILRTNYNRFANRNRMMRDAALKPFVNRIRAHQHFLIQCTQAGQTIILI
jgi:hypothetical protein